MSPFDELRFGPQRTLNLRENLPLAADAERRAESWLREHQVLGSKEVLVVTGRGNQSLGGVPVIRGVVERLLFSLRRRGVVASHKEHNPGAFVVELAPMRALVEVPPRRREPARTLPMATFHGLGDETLSMLRELAERSLDALGVTYSERSVEDEMHRYLGALIPGLGGRSRMMEDRLRAAIRAAITEYD